MAGAGFFAGTSGAVMVAAAVLVRRRLRTDLVTGVLGWVVLASVGVLAVHLVPGIVGVLSRGTAMACGLAVLAAALLTPPSPTRLAGERPAPPGSRAGVVLAGLGVLAALATAAAVLRGQLFIPVQSVDSLTFHLPDIAAWMQAGSYWINPQYVPLFFSGNYPQNGNVVLMAVMLPWSNDALVRFVDLPYLAATAAATYALCRELRAPVATSVLFGVAIVCIPVVFRVGVETGLPDPIMLTGYATGALFLVRHLRTADRRDLVLGGLGLGLAFGSKWYALPAVAIAIAVWAGGLFAVRRSVRGVAGSTSLVGGLVLVTGGFWLVRNWVETGNPVMPVRLEVAGLTILDAPRDVVREQFGFAVWDYLGDLAIVRDEVLPGWLGGLGAIGPIVLLLAVAGAIVAARRLRGAPAPDRAQAAAILGTTAAALLYALVYLRTPYTALGPEGDPQLIKQNSRYLVPALLLLAGPAAWFTGRLGRAGLAVQAAVLLAVLDALPRPFPALGLSSIAAYAVVLAVLAAAGWSVRGRLTALATGPATRRAVPAVAATVLGLALVAAYEQQRRFNADRYRPYDATFAYVADHVPEGSSVGLAGTWGDDGLAPIYPMFGDRLANPVTFVGPFVDGGLTRYGDRAAWSTAVRRGRYDFLLVSRGFPPTAQTDEIAWARDLGYRTVAGSRRLTLMASPARN